MRTPFGELRFGRMPSHWGIGMLVNNGDCLDCDFGVNADRVMFATKLWGHFIAFMWDWVATGPTTQLIGPQQGQGVFYNADTLDDVSQWILALGKQDKPEELKEKLDQGKVVFNYGGYFVYRQQDWDQDGQRCSRRATPIRRCRTASILASAKAFIGDIWLRLNWKKLHIEGEGALIAGTIGNLHRRLRRRSRARRRSCRAASSSRPTTSCCTTRSRSYLEVGYASGDDSEDPNANVNYRLRQPGAGQQRRSTASTSTPTTTST